MLAEHFGSIGLRKVWLLIGRNSNWNFEKKKHNTTIFSYPILELFSPCLLVKCRGERDRRERSKERGRDRDERESGRHRNVGLEVENENTGTEREANVMSIMIQTENMNGNVITAAGIEVEYAPNFCRHHENCVF
ncbi:hypothetical protein ACJIZ3_023955 [Penstemon smallii]|uniref:Uncharacterized protein n=1 Tax=Penstemon smallii TaxID=265156 RepID=A0ABD3TQH8_9LAMI